MIIIHISTYPVCMYICMYVCTVHMHLCRYVLTYLVISCSEDIITIWWAGLLASIPSLKGAVNITDHHLICFVTYVARDIFSILLYILINKTLCHSIHNYIWYISIMQTLNFLLEAPLLGQAILTDNASKGNWFIKVFHIHFRNNSIITEAATISLTIDMYIHTVVPAPKISPPRFKERIKEKVMETIWKPPSCQGRP